MFSRRATGTTRTWPLLLLVVAAGWAAGQLGCGMTRPEPPPVVDLPPLEARADSLDFGEVVESSTFRHEVTLRNISTAPLTVRLTKMCDCAGIEPKELRLAPGEAGRVVLRLDLMHNRARYVGHGVRPFAAHFEARWGDRAGDQATLEVHGNVRAILDLWPPNLHLREGLVEGEDGPEEQVEITPYLSLDDCAVEQSPANIQAWTRSTPTGYTLFVRPRAGLPVGRFEKTITLRVRDTKGKDLPVQPLAVSGTVTGRVVCVPHEGSFGMHPVGSVVEEAVCLRGRVPGPFSVASVAADHPAVRVEALGSRPGETSYRVRWRIERPGDQRANVTFVVRDGRAKEHRVGFALRCYGTSIE